MNIEDTIQEYKDTMRLMGKEIPFDIEIKGENVIAKRVELGSRGYTEDVVIPEFITVIDSGTFAHFSKIDNVVIPDSVKYLGDGVFLGCRSIKQMVIPLSVKYIGTRLFQCCDSLIRLKVPLRFKSMCEEGSLELEESCRVIYLKEEKSNGE